MVIILTNQINGLNSPTLNPNKMYYNTTNEKGHELTTKTEKAQSQTDRIYKLFRMVKDASPSFIFNMMAERYDNLLLTSVRRSISDLTREGKLIKTDKKVMGLNGSKEFVWEIV